jgi:catechol 2,3-dioxygenase-like lactoylglutathione lyase family enzyme
MRLDYAIKFVRDMDAAVPFYRDTLGLNLGSNRLSGGEFETGETKLALHPASDENPEGTVQLGFGIDDIDAFYAEGQSKGLTFHVAACRPTRDANRALS